jgi:hypothetical protein
VGVLVGHQELGGVAFGVQRVGGDGHAGQVQAGQQWLEAGDLLGGAVHLVLGEHRAGGVVERGEEVDGSAAGLGGATQGLAVHGDRLWLVWAGHRQPVGQPGGDRCVQRVPIDRGQHAPQGGLAGDAMLAGKGITSHAERGQHQRRGVSRPLGDRGQRPGTGQDRRGRQREHTGQRVTQASTVARVGYLGQALQQVRTLDRVQ